MYVKLARFLAVRPLKVLVFWIVMVIASALMAATGFGTPLWERLVSDVPQATPSDSNSGQKLLDAQATKDYGVVAYITGIDLKAEYLEAPKLAAQLKQLKEQAESQGDEATQLGDQAQAAATPAQDLGDEATALGNQAQNLGANAKTLGELARQLGDQAQAEGEVAQTLKTRAEAAAAQAKDLGAQAQDLKTQAEAAAAQAAAAGGPQLQQLQAQAEAAAAQAATLTAQAHTQDERAKTLQAQSATAATQAEQLTAAGDTQGAALAQAQAQDLAAAAAKAQTQAAALAAQAQAQTDRTQQLQAQAQAAATPEIRQLMARAQDLAAQAQQTGTRAEAAATQAKDLGTQAQEAGTRAQETAAHAQANAAQARRLGQEATTLGGQAESKGAQAKDQGKIAADLGVRARALGDSARELGERATQLAEPDWPVARALHAALAKAEADLKEIAQVKSVSHPFVEYNAMLDPQARALVAKDGHGFVFVVNLDLSQGSETGKLPSADMLRVLRRVEARLAGLYNDIRGDGLAPGTPSHALRVRITDQRLVHDSALQTLRNDLTRSEAIGIPLSFLIMAVVFGGFATALLPLGGAAVAITAALAIMMGMTYLFEQQSFAVNVISVMGLGLSIDYGLLIVSRFREELARLRKLTPDQYGLDLSGVRSARARARLEALNPRYLRALEVTLATAGRTTFFSALTVSVASGGMLFFRPDLLKSLGIAGASVVLLSMIGALTLVSALMFRFAGSIEKLSVLAKIPGLRRLVAAADPEHSHALEVASGGEVAGAEAANLEPGSATLVGAEAANLEPGNATSTPQPKAGLARPRKLTFFDRFAGFITRWSWPSFIVSAVVLVLACVPLGDLHLRNSLVNLLPLQSQQRILMEDLNQQVPRAGMTPIQIVAPGVSPEELDEWTARHVAGVEGVSQVFAASSLRSDGATAKVRLEGQDFGSRQAEDVVRQIRAASHDFELYVTGQAANQLDFVGSLEQGLPWVLGVLVMMTFVLLFLMTGSVMIPLQALVINTLSLVATLGISTLVFVDGWGVGLLGAKALPGLESYVVVMLMCFGFGLSMDYELFLLSRMKEVWDRTGSAKLSVIVGLSQSARIVTSAATILVFVFLCFVTGHMIVLKEIGFILALAVALDATVVRMVLVPSAMAILGRANWWAPGPLRRWQQRVSQRLGQIG